MHWLIDSTSHGSMTQAIRLQLFLCWFVYCATPFLFKTIVARSEELLLCMHVGLWYT